MFSGRSFLHRLSLGLSLLLCAEASQVSIAAQQNNSRNSDDKATSVAGRRIFDSTCAGCHGLDGRGSGRAANIAENAKVQRFSDAQISRIILNGMPGSGMPAFRSLSKEQIRSLVGYLRMLQGKLEPQTLPGIAAQGRSIFFGKGECSNCHAISGEGGFLGPDLSAYGSGRSAKAIRDEIIRPDRIQAPGFRAAVVTTQDGDRLEGVIRNEDNFSIQLQTKDGMFHFLQKSDLRSVEPRSQPLMPTDYSARLSHGELDDLVSYLMKASAAVHEVRSSRPAEDPSE